MTKKSGFTIIEVLVALLIISIGLLGVAGLIAESQKSVLEVQQREIALRLANDIIARMTTNGDALSTYDGTVNSAIAEPGTLCDSSNANCTPDQLAAWDLWQWSNNLHGSVIQTASDTNAGGLVNPVACIEIDSNNVSLSIAWRGKFTRPDSHADKTCGDDNARFKSDATKNDLRRMLTVSTTINS